MMNRRGVELTLNTIIVAVLVLVVLVVMFAIYTRFIGKSAEDIGAVGDEAGRQVNDITWCMPTTLKGQSCEIEKGKTGCSAPIYTKSGEGCSITCPAGKTRKIIQGSGAVTYDCGNAKKGEFVTSVSSRYTCCT